VVKTRPEMLSFSVAIALALEFDGPAIRPLSDFDHGMAAGLGCARQVLHGLGVIYPYSDPSTRREAFEENLRPSPVERASDTAKVEVGRCFQGGLHGDRSCYWRVGCETLASVIGPKFSS
jgi:hypothetical protein